MRVPTVAPGRGTDAVRRKERKGGSGPEFAEHLRSAADDVPAGDVHAGAVAPADAAIAAQEVADGGDERRRRNAQRHADSLLDRLEALRLALLSGAVPKDRLAELARALRARRDATGDPRLDEIVAEIELRCEVEIAKLARGG